MASSSNSSVQQSFKKAFFKNKKKEVAEKWKGALKEASDLAGWELKNTLDGHEAKFINKIGQEISLELRSINFSFYEKLVGMETRGRDVISSLEIGIDYVRMIGIKGMGGAGKTTTARAVFDHLSHDFEAKSFVENVREVSNASMFGLKNLQEQVLSNVLKEKVTLDSVNDGKNMMKRMMCGKKVLLVLDDVDHIEQLKALAGEPNWFKPGSRILITSRDEQVLVAHRVNAIRDIVLLSEQEAISLFSRYAFGRENPLQGYEELSGKVVSYAAGLPLTLEVLGSFICGKDKLEWVDAIKRLEKIPLKDTLEKLELSYISLEDEYKEIFLDIVCIRKGQTKEDAIRILECCGFHARIGLKVLEQRSLLTISSKYGLLVLGMHDHIEEMGKNIVRRSHPDEPNKHSHLWIDEEIEDILANDMGTEATRCLRLDMSRGNSRILMKGLGKMKKLRYLEVNFPDYDTESDSESDGECLGSDPKFDIPNSLKYLKCDRITPNLETLSLEYSYELVELCMPVCCQKLKDLHISSSKLRTFDLGLTPNLEMLSLENCAHFVELHVPVACPNLKSLYLRNSRLRSLDLELIPNLEKLDLTNCFELVEINAPVGCLKKVVGLNLSGCALLEKLPENLGRLEQIQLYKFPSDILTTTLDIRPWKCRKIMKFGEGKCKKMGEDELIVFDFSEIFSCFSVGTETYWVPLIEADSCKEIKCKYNGPRSITRQEENLLCVKIHKDARFHFEIRTHQRLIHILHLTAQTMDSLMQLDLPSVLMSRLALSVYFKSNKGQGLDPYPLHGRSPFLPLVEPEAASLPLVWEGLTTSQPPHTP
nr:Toll/interleukin-1 receptor (TIR) domain-containing protein [Tanacetum cinerariifolium]